MMEAEKAEKAEKAEEVTGIGVRGKGGRRGGRGEKRGGGGKRGGGRGGGGRVFRPETLGPLSKDALYKPPTKIETRAFERCLAERISGGDGPGSEYSTRPHAHNNNGEHSCARSIAQRSLLSSQ